MLKKQKPNEPHNYLYNRCPINSVKSVRIFPFVGTPTWRLVPPQHWWPLSKYFMIILLIQIGILNSNIMFLSGLTLHINSRLCTKQTPKTNTGTQNYRTDFWITFCNCLSEDESLSESAVNVSGRLPSTSHEENDKQGAGWDGRSAQYIVIMTFGEG